MLDGLGALWVTQAGSAVLAGFLLIIIYSLGKNRGLRHVEHTLCYSWISIAPKDVSTKELTDLAKRGSFAEYRAEEGARWEERCSYAAGFFAAPGLAELVGVVEVFRDVDGYPEWVDVESFFAIVGLAAIGYAVARIVGIAAFRFYSAKEYKVMVNACPSSDDLRQGSVYGSEVLAHLY